MLERRAVDGGELGGGGDDGGDLIDAPIQVGAVDRQRRGEPDDGLVGLLAEDATLLQRLAEGTRGNVEVEDAVRVESGWLKTGE